MPGFILPLVYRWRLLGVCEGNEDSALEPKGELPVIQRLSKQNFKTEWAVQEGEFHKGFHLRSWSTNMPEFPPEEFDSLTPILTPTTYRVPVSPAKKTVKNRLDATHHTLTGREKADLTSANQFCLKNGISWMIIYVLHWSQCQVRAGPLTGHQPPKAPTPISLKDSYGLSKLLPIEIKPNDSTAVFTWSSWWFTFIQGFILFISILTLLTSPDSVISINEDL